MYNQHHLQCTGPRDVMSGQIKPPCRFWDKERKMNSWGKFTCDQFPKEISNENAFTYGACRCYRPIPSSEAKLLVLADVKERDASLVRDGEGRLFLMPLGKKVDLTMVKTLDSRGMLKWKSKDLRYITLSNSDDPDDYELM